MDETLCVLEKAHLFELVLQLAKHLYEYYLSSGKYELLEKIGTRISEWGRLATTTVRLVSNPTNSAKIQSDSRIFSNFYRVGFYGKSFGVDFNQKQYIFAASPSERLAEFSARIVVCTPACSHIYRLLRETLEANSTRK